jgi:hypothetical protein
VNVKIVRVAQEEIKEGENVVFFAPFFHAGGNVGVSGIESNFSGYFCPRFYLYTYIFLLGLV